MCVQRSSPVGPAVVNDVNVQYTNVTDSMKLCNTKLCVVGHYFCCTIPQAGTVGGREKRERDAFSRLALVHSKINFKLIFNFDICT